MLLGYWLSVLKMRKNIKFAEEIAMLCPTSRQSFGSVTWRQVQAGIADEKPTWTQLDSNPSNK